MDNVLQIRVIKAFTFDLNINRGHLHLVLNNLPISVHDLDLNVIELSSGNPFTVTVTVTLTFNIVTSNVMPNLWKKLF